MQLFQCENIFFFLALEKETPSFIAVYTSELKIYTIVSVGLNLEDKLLVFYGSDVMYKADYMHNSNPAYKQHPIMTEIGSLQPRGNIFTISQGRTFGHQLS